MSEKWKAVSGKCKCGKPATRMQLGKYPRCEGCFEQWKARRYGCISTVLDGIQFDDYVSLAEQAERERLANERMQAVESDKLKVERELPERPEYIQFKNAVVKEKAYRKHVAFARWEDAQFRRKHEQERESECTSSF